MCRRDQCARAPPHLRHEEPAPREVRVVASAHAPRQVEAERQRQPRREGRADHARVVGRVLPPGHARDARDGGRSHARRRPFARAKLQGATRAVLVSRCDRFLPSGSLCLPSHRHPTSTHPLPISYKLL
eukprot:4608879-Pleurochrysis_carterae.AAC.3